MSFATDLYTIMTGDASLNAEATGGIFYENLEDNFDLAKKWILYHFRKEQQIDCLGIKNAYTEYEETITVIATNTVDVLDISDQLVTYLNGAAYGEVVDITFTGDGHSFDQDKNIYMNTLTFNVIGE